MENNVPLHHRVFFNVQSDNHPHVHQSAKFEVEEAMNCTDRFEADLNALANKLNSGESLRPETTFTVDLTVIETPPKGSKWKMTLGRLPIVDVLNRKQPVLLIENYKDDLCCARAICYTMAWLHREDCEEECIAFDNMRRYGDTLQPRVARNSISP